MPTVEKKRTKQEKQDTKCKKSIAKKRTSKTPKVLTQNVLTEKQIKHADKKGVYVGCDVSVGNKFTRQGLVDFNRETGEFVARFDLRVLGKPFSPQRMVPLNYGFGDEIQFLMRLNPDDTKNKTRYAKVCFTHRKECAALEEAFRILISGKNLYDSVCVPDLVYILAALKPKKMAEFTRIIEEGTENEDVIDLISEDMKERLLKIWFDVAFSFPLRLRAILYHPDLSNDDDF